MNFFNQEEMSPIIQENEINNVLSNYSNSNDNPKNVVKIHGIMKNCRNRRIYLEGDDYDIKCNIKSESFERYRRNLRDAIDDDYNHYVVMRGIPYFCGFTLKLAVKQAEIIEIL